MMKQAFRFFAGVLPAAALLLSLLTGCMSVSAPAPPEAAPLPPIDLASAVREDLPPMGEVRRAGSMLSETEQHVYAGMVRELDALSEELSFTDVDSDTVCRAWEAIMADYPEFFWLSGSYQWGGWEGLGFLWFRPEYLTPVDSVPAMRQQAEAVCEELLAESAGMDEYHRALFFHDTLVQSTVYDAQIAAAVPDRGIHSLSSTAFGCLVNHKAVCTGYARAFQWLAQRSGIECLRAEGTDRKDGVGHEWNCIRLAGDYYYVDVTWDDPVGDMGERYVRYDYFGINDEEFGKTHRPDKNRYMNYPSARSDDANYFVVNDLICDDGRAADVTMSRAIKLAVENKDGFARIKCTDKDAYRHALIKLFETNDGTTEMFALLNKALSGRGTAPIVTYSLIQNDETYTITVRFDL